MTTEQRLERENRWRPSPWAARARWPHLAVCGAFAIAVAFAGDDGAGQWSPSADPIESAVQVWRRGRDYFPKEPEEIWTRVSDEFQAIDWGVASYLRDPRPWGISRRYPRADWTCSASGGGFLFWRLRNGLVSEYQAVQLQALVVLVNSGTSVNVREQWRVAQELRDHWAEGTRERALVGEILKCFNQAEIEKRLSDASEPLLDGAGPRSLLWLIGARSCARSPDAVATLGRYALHGDSDVAVTSVEGLRSIDSHESRQALAAVVRKGSWPAAMWAAGALREQAPEILRRIVSDSTVAPEGRWFALWGLSRETIGAVPEICRRALSLKPGRQELAEKAVCAWVKTKAIPADAESVRAFASHLGKAEEWAEFLDRLAAASKENADR